MTALLAVVAKLPELHSLSAYANTPKGALADLLDMPLKAFQIATTIPNPHCICIFSAGAFACAKISVHEHKFE